MPAGKTVLCGAYKWTTQMKYVKKQEVYLGVTNLAFRSQKGRTPVGYKYKNNNVHNEIAMKKKQK